MDFETRPCIRYNIVHENRKIKGESILNRISVHLPSKGSQHTSRILTISHGTTLAELAERLGSTPHDPRRHLVAAYVDNRLCSLSEPIVKSCHIRFLDLADIEGQRVYQRTLLFLLCAAVKWTFPEEQVLIRHSLSNGVYGEISGLNCLSDEDVRRIDACLRELISKNQPIHRLTLSPDDAIKFIHEKATPSHAASLRTLWKQLNGQPITLHQVAGFVDYLDGPTLPSTGHARFFRLHLHPPGFVLQTPEKAEPPGIPAYVEQPRLVQAYRSARKWASKLKATHVAALNERLAEKAPAIIQLAEALHEKNIGRIAKRIAASPDRRLVAIAGPSASGKTTFSRRLADQLRAHGMCPHILHLDDYFRGRDKAPLDENGDLDLEHIEVVDLELLNDHLARLMRGEAIAPPTYNFETGERGRPQREIRLEPDQPVIVEGIHALNERLTASVPKTNQFRIYITALTPINLHDRVRIHSTDIRLIRRMIRDARSRNYRAEQTLARWPSVRRGEKRFVFPFQEDVDVIFDSGLIYELAVLKPFAVELLDDIPASSSVRPLADRLLALCDHVSALTAEALIPPHSILREFIGGSCYE